MSGVRDATAADLDRLIGMSRDYYEVYSPAWPFCEGTMRKLYLSLIERDEGLLIISDTGFLGAMKHPNILNPAWIIASELLWWGDAGLIRHFRKWAKGVHEIRYSCPPSSKANKTFGRLGDPIETVYSEVMPCASQQ